MLSSYDLVGSDGDGVDFFVIVGVGFDLVGL